VTDNLLQEILRLHGHHVAARASRHVHSRHAGLALRASLLRESYGGKNENQQ
jgi:hypothetical protein